MKVVLKKLNNKALQISNIVKDVLHKYYKIDDYKLKTTRDGNMYIDGNLVYLSISNTDSYLFMVFDKKPLGCDIEYLSSSDKDAIKALATKNAIERLKDISKSEGKGYNIKTKMIGKNIISIVTYKD